MTYWKKRGTNDAPIILEKIDGRYKIGQDILTLSEISDQFSQVNTLQEIKEAFAAGAGWQADNGTAYYSFTISTDEPSEHLTSGTEIMGIYSGYSFTSNDKLVSISTVDGIRGMINAMLYITLDRKFVIFH
jgi:hypothetical protein